jgi:hypothetical protein
VKVLLGLNKIKNTPSLMHLHDSRSYNYPPKKWSLPKMRPFVNSLKYFKNSI